MHDETDHERVVEALDDLLTRFSDPRTADRETFLRARYDAGLGWVHFEPGFGGLGVAASWQQVVEDRVGLLGAPAPGSGDFGRLMLFKGTRDRCPRRRAANTALRLTTGNTAKRPKCSMSVALLRNKVAATQISIITKIE